MLPLFTQEQLLNAKNYEKLSFQCQQCKNPFDIEVKWIKSHLKRSNQNRYLFCNRSCYKLSLIKIIDGYCGQCIEPIKIIPSQQKRSKSGKSFCSQKCAATYNNTHKTTGNRRSKLEIWLEQKLTKQYPDLEIKYNDKVAINSELDIYIPSLNLAFELNGIFHYEPIFGQNKLLSTQNNDNRKFQACLEHNIELVIIDSSPVKYFKPQNVIKYLDIINQVITSKIGPIGGT